MKETIVSTKQYEPLEIAQLWKELLADNPKIRIRDAAELLGVTESQLLATKIGDSVVRLDGEWETFMKHLPSLGRVMSLTRNDGCVLENKGEFEKIDVHPHATTVIGSIETRAFLKNWSIGYAVTAELKGKTLKSLQIFDKYGVAITKIYLQIDSNINKYNELVEKFTARDQSTYQEVAKNKTKEITVPDFDKEALKNDWSKLKDTHEFFMLLRKHKANRLDAIESVVPDFARKIDKQKIENVLNSVSDLNIPIMIFAGNPGNIQIHQGAVNKIVVMGKWLNVLDQNVNMHLDMDLVESAWIITKPTRDGEVHSIEIFDDKKELIVQLFGLRKPGNPELKEWRDLLSKIS